MWDPAQRFRGIRHLHKSSAIARYRRDPVLAALAIGAMLMASQGSERTTGTARLLPTPMLSVPDLGFSC
jgi:hypothetical protein